MNLLHAYFIGKALSRSCKTKPRTAGELIKDAALGWLYFFLFIGALVLLFCLTNILL